MHDLISMFTVYNYSAKLSYLNSNFALNPALKSLPLLDKQLQNFIYIFNPNVPLKKLFTQSSVAHTALVSVLAV